MEHFEHQFRNLDPGDKHDSFKWNFDENKGLETVLGQDNYIYKLKSTNENNKNKLQKLQDIRSKVGNVMYYIHSKLSQYPPEIQNGLKLLISIHAEMPMESSEILQLPEELESMVKKHWIGSGGYCSNVIYSEMPNGTPFQGLNKPKDRYINRKAPSIGPDKQLRSKWRHVFIKLPNNNKLFLEDKSLQNLVIHEIAHTAANHVRWRPDDHGKDFKMYEKAIKDAWNKV